MNRLTVLGFGLIGGSIGLGARTSGAFTEVTAVDTPEVLALARTMNAADVFVDRAAREQVEKALSGSTLVVLATPVQGICDSVEWVLSHAPVVTDCGSTKRRIVQLANRSPFASRFVAGHPMAGLPEGGLANARGELFRGRNWLLCPGEADRDAVQQVEALIAALGAKSIALSAADHDAAVARTSHLPQLLASALRVLGARHAGAGAAGPAFERATGAAGGPEPLWHDIFSSNADEIARAIRELCAELEPVACELADGQRITRALGLLDRARRLRP